MDKPDLSSNPLLQATKRMEAQSSSPPSYQVPRQNQAARVVVAPPRDGKGQPLADDKGRPLPGSTKGLKPFAVKLPDLPETRVWARDEDHAWKVFKAEWGITKTDHDWQVEPIGDEEAA